MSANQRDKTLRRKNAGDRIQAVTYKGETFSMFRENLSGSEWRS